MRLICEFRRNPEFAEQRLEGLYSAKNMMMILKRSGIRSAGLEPAEFAAVLFSKGSRLSNANRNSAADVKEKTREAFSRVGTERSPLEPLLEIHGVGVSVASAILSWVFPEKYGIMDFHSKRAANFFGEIDFDEYAPSSEQRYDEFNQFLRQTSSNIENATPQKLDLWLYNYSINRWGERGTVDRRNL